jgi:CubicO group peptidase (beta-lactamase class C family)
MTSHTILCLLLCCLSACRDVGAGDKTPVALNTKEPFPQKTRSYWPTAGWQTASPEEVGIDSVMLKELEEYLFRRNGDEDDRKGQRTNAFVLIKDGKLIFERYARGYTPETPLLLWSVSKSIGNTLLGIAVQEGKLNINDPASKYYSPLDKPGHKEIRVTDLLRMSSGISWSETYETSPLFSSVLAMLYTRGHSDMAAFVAAQPMEYAPGTHWNYSSGDANLLSAVLRGAVGEEYASYPWVKLFDKLGIKNAVFERDAAGTFLSSSYLYLTGRDLAKWAFLYINDGSWDGQRILPQGWVEYSTTMAPAYYTTEIGAALLEDNPGAQFYVNVGDPKRNIEKPWPEAPSDLFGGLGHWGKSVFVIPSLDLIIVRLGDDREHACGYAGEEDCVFDAEKAFSKRQMLKLLMNAVKK